MRPVTNQPDPLADNRLTVPDSPVLLQEAVWRWGQRALGSALAAGIALTFLVAWQAPEAVPLVPVVLLGMGAVALLSRYPLVNLGVVLAGFAFAINSDEGLQVSEVLYGLYLYTYLLLWYTGRLLRGERFVLSGTDWAAVLLIVGGGLLGTVTGVLFGADLGAMRGDLTAFFILALYFPAKEACRCTRRGPEIIFVSLIGLGVFLGIQNLVVFRSIIASADLAWEVADARFPATEALIMVSTFGVLFLLLAVEGWRSRAVLAGLLLFMLASLVLTKGRTYWVAFAFGTVLSLLFLGGRQRYRLVLMTTVGSAALLAITLTFFGQLADLIFSGTLNRLATLEGAASQDISLIGRFVEWDALWDYIVQNPILGYGFGSTFQFYNIIEAGTVNRTFTHNGFLGAWFKLGLFGLLVLLALWGGALWDAFQVRQNALLPVRHHSYALVSLISLISLGLAANTSIFFIYMNQLFPFILLAALASGLRQRGATYSSGERTAPPL